MTLRRLAPYAILATAVVALLVVPPLEGTSASEQNVFNILQHFASYGGLALALGLLMIAGEFDLSISALFALAAMVAVKTGGSAPVLGALVALAAGVAAGLVQGGIVARTGLSSMPVTVGGYIALLGLTQILGDESTVSYTNYGVGDVLDHRFAEVLSTRSVAVLACFAILGWALARTRWGRDVRAVGGDRRSARTAGVRVPTVLVSAFVVAAAIVALSGTAVGYSLASATPTYASLSNLIYAATAALLGGVALSGGVGTIGGIAAGALSLSTLQEILSIVAAPAYVSELVTGGLLLTVSVLFAPELLRRGGLRLRRGAPAS